MDADDPRAPDDLLTTAEAAAALGIHPSNVRRLVGLGRLPATKRGRDLWIRVADLDLVRYRKPGRPKATPATPRPPACPKDG